MITQAERTSSQLAHKAEQRLEGILQEFDLWASTAVRSGDGWEGHFPLWLDLNQAAERVMAAKTQDAHSLLLLGRCWAITEEDETCADWAREHLRNELTRKLVRQLAADPDPRTRWQACDVLGGLSPLDAATLNVLEVSTEDENPYVRRRAFLALMRHTEADPQPYVKRMLSDTDSYNRYVAVGRYDPRIIPEALLEQIRTVAQDPEVARLLAAE